MRSRSVPTCIAATISRRSTAIGWRRAMVSIARSSISRCSLSTLGVAAITTLGEGDVARTSASTRIDRHARSAMPPISATSRGQGSLQIVVVGLAVCSVPHDNDLLEAIRCCDVSRSGR